MPRLTFFLFSLAALRARALVSLRAPASRGSALRAYLDTLSPPSPPPAATWGSYLDSLSPLPPADAEPAGASYLDSLAAVPAQDAAADAAEAAKLAEPAQDPAAERAITSLFDFASGDGSAVAAFERIDDAIMGGISTSAVRDVPGEGCASWSGICRTEGGGFCGMRTLPFETPLDLTRFAGIHVRCRLVSDDEPHRRTWKMTLRTEASRGEIVYQTMYKLEADADAEGWRDVYIPFVDFRMVRGARLVEDAPPLDLARGVYQVGMTMSKFGMGKEMVTIPDFRDGYFDLRLKSIGAYGEAAQTVRTPATVSKEEAARRRPILAKALRWTLGAVFSEKARRRGAALKILRGRGTSRAQAFVLATRSRARGAGWPRALARNVVVAGGDGMRAVVQLAFRYGVFKPLFWLSRTMKALQKKQAEGKTTELQTSE
mmetsp:Transcript_8914/g.19624  ORF Transcript_8914/g.19624 Transcript_8914/m.19624 type:complete len:431 (-) Transcript_8914:127-1419(-)